MINIKKKKINIPVNKDTKEKGGDMAEGAKRKSSALYQKLTTSKMSKLNSGKKNTTPITSEAIERSYKLLIKDYGSPSDRTKTYKGPKPNLTTSRERLSAATQAQSTEERKESGHNDWELPKNPARPKTAGATATSIEHANSFEALAANENTMDYEQEAGCSADRSETQNNISEENNNRTKKIRPPPIHITNTNIKDTITLLTTNNLKKGDYQLKQVSNAEKPTTTVYTNELEHYEKILGIVSNENKQFYTYTPKNKKPKSIILKGVNGGFAADAILEELDSLNLQNVRIGKVTEISFGKRTQTNKNALFLVQISQDSDISELTKTRLLLHQVVKWEYLRKEKIFQCKRCQRLGHASSNCRLVFRCVKCGLDHGPQKCALKEQDPRSSLKCCNCGQEGHPANYRGCSYYKHALNMVKNNNTIKNQERLAKTHTISRTYNPNISYATMTRPHPNQDTFTQQRTEQTTRQTNNQNTHTPKITGKITRQHG